MTCLVRTTPTLLRPFACHLVGKWSSVARLLITKHSPVTDPWDDRLYSFFLRIHEWWIFMVHAGKYTIHGSYGSGRHFCLKTRLTLYQTTKRPSVDEFRWITIFYHPKDPWTLQWRGSNMYSRGPGSQNRHFWGVRILRAISNTWNKIILKDSHT